MPGDTITKQERNAALVGTPYEDTLVLQSLRVWLEDFKDFCLPSDKPVVLSSVLRKRFESSFHTF